MPKRKRQFRNSVVMTFAAAAGCAQVTHGGGEPGAVDGQRPVTSPMPAATTTTVTTPIVSVNPPRPVAMAGGGAGVAGWNPTLAGATPPTNPPHENCPAMPPTRGTPCNVGMI